MWKLPEFLWYCLQALVKLCCGYMHSTSRPAPDAIIDCVLVLSSLSLLSRLSARFQWGVSRTSSLNTVQYCHHCYLHTYVVRSIAAWKARFSSQSSLHSYVIVDTWYWMIKLILCCIFYEHLLQRYIINLEPNLSLVRFVDCQDTSIDDCSRSSTCTRTRDSNERWLYSEFLCRVCGV